jgi:hypothetical protein
VVYDVIYNDPDGGSPRLKEAWRVRAGQHFDSSRSPEECQQHHRGDDSTTTTSSDNKIGDEDKKGVVEKTSTPAASVSCKKDTTALDYHYGDAFYMAEINPSGNVFAVEERPGRSTLARLYSPRGEPLNSSELHVHAPTTVSDAAADDTKESAEADGCEGDKKLGVQTLLISTYKAGCYALVVQGGYALFIDAEKLTITSCFKLVSI